MYTIYICTYMGLLAGLTGCGLGSPTVVVYHQKVQEFSPQG